MEDYTIGFAEPQDAADIVELFSNISRLEITQLQIYGCKGASEYLRMHLTSSDRALDSAFFAAKTPSGQVIAAAEMRRRAGAVHLNHITVHPEHRGRGVGAALFATAINMLEISSGPIELDVFLDNISALKWYRRLGFENVSSSVFLELVPPCRSDCEPAFISGLPQADVCHERFGFSQLTLVTFSGTYTVGRIGSTWFRLTQKEAIDKPEIFALLKQLDPRRRIYAIVPAFSVPNAPVRRVVAKTYRMGTTVDKLITKLTHAYEKC